MDAPPSRARRRPGGIVPRVGLPSGARQVPGNSPAVASLSAKDLEALLLARGLPRFRARQIRDAVLRRARRSFDEMSDLPKDLRASLAGILRVHSSRVESVRRSTDGTVKLLVLLEDGRRVESVTIPEGGRTTL